MDGRDLARAVALARTGFGASAILFPRAMARLFFDAEEGRRPASRLLGRLFGIRDVALGAAALRSLSRGEDAREEIRLGMACDLADIAVLLAGGARGLRPRTVLLGVAAAGAFAAASARATRPGPASIPFDA